MPESTGTGHRAITLDVGLPTLGEPFRGHVLLARRIGLSDDEIRDAVRLAAELCSARTAVALAELDQVLRGSSVGAARSRPVHVHPGTTSISTPVCIRASRPGSIGRSPALIRNTTVPGTGYL